MMTFADILFVLKQKKGKKIDHKAEFTLKLMETWIIQFLYDNKKDGRKVF